jgi:molybdenum cofactor biosynthesis enzyme MoaA
MCNGIKIALFSSLVFCCNIQLNSNIGNIHDTCVIEYDSTNNEHVLYQKGEVIIPQEIKQELDEFEIQKDKFNQFKDNTRALSLFLSKNKIEQIHLLKSIEENFSSNIKRMMITGSGDPFYSKIYRDYLINFDKSKYPNLEQIQIITNGNLLNEKLWKKMKATPYIKTIEVSIDAATKDTYETKTRLNGQWDVLIKNLKFLATQDDLIEQFVCSMVVSKHNYKEVSTFYELITDIFKDSKFKWGISVNYRQIVDWGTYSSEELQGLQIFQKEHPLYNDFIKEIKKIDNLKYVNHNFHHLLKNII